MIQIHKQNVHNEDRIDQIIKLLLCSGAAINESVYEIPMQGHQGQGHQGQGRGRGRHQYKNYVSKISAFVHDRITLCCNLLYGEKNVDDTRDRLKNELIITMDEICGDEIGTMDLIDRAMNQIIPIPCVKIIYEYHLFFKFIDWSKF